MDAWRRLDYGSTKSPQEESESDPCHLRSSQRAPTTTRDALDGADDHFLSRDLDVSLAGRELSTTPQGDLFTLLSSLLPGDLQEVVRSDAGSQ
jgi:hypothetical protein